MDSADTAVRNAALAIGDFITNMVGGEHRLIAASQILFIQTTLDSTLAVG